MTEPLPDSLTGFIDRLETAERALLVVNRTEPEQLVDLLERGTGSQPISVGERQVPEGVEDLVCLLADGEVVATSPLQELKAAYLMVNADRYRTGTHQIQSGSFPSVLTGLEDVEFTVRGYPASAKEKLLLILVSRWIEFEALSHGRGTLRSSFQYLSRLDDEYGTRTVYEWLADTDVATHLYGVDDDPSAAADIGATLHTGDHEEYRHSWVVVFSPPESDVASRGTDHAALVAVETDANRWRGFWTRDAERVRRIDEYVQRRF